MYQITNQLQEAEYVFTTYLKIRVIIYIQKLSGLSRWDQIQSSIVKRGTNVSGQPAFSMFIVDKLETPASAPLFENALLNKPKFSVFPTVLMEMYKVTSCSQNVLARTAILIVTVVN